MLEWLLAIAALILFLVLLPRILRGAKPVRAKGGGSGVWVGIGLAFAMVFDPKFAQTTELIARKKDIGDSEDGQSDDRREGSIGSP